MHGIISVFLLAHPLQFKFHFTNTIVLRYENSRCFVFRCPLFISLDNGKIPFVGSISSIGGLRDNDTGIIQKNKERKKKNTEP